MSPSARSSNQCNQCNQCNQAIKQSRNHAIKQSAERTLADVALGQVEESVQSVQSEQSRNQAISRAHLGRCRPRPGRARCAVRRASGCQSSNQCNRCKPCDRAISTTKHQYNQA
eukprot:4238126-Prymnesium_polylepis.1